MGVSAPHLRRRQDVVLPSLRHAMPSPRRRVGWGRRWPRPSPCVRSSLRRTLSFFVFFWGSALQVIRDGSIGRVVTEQQVGRIVCQLGDALERHIHGAAQDLDGGDSCFLCAPSMPRTTHKAQSWPQQCGLSAQRHRTESTNQKVCGARSTPMRP